MKTKCDECEDDGSVCVFCGGTGQMEVDAAKNRRIAELEAQVERLKESEDIIYGQTI